MPYWRTWDYPRWQSGKQRYKSLDNDDIAIEIAQHLIDRHYEAIDLLRAHAGEYVLEGSLHHSRYIQSEIITPLENYDFITAQNGASELDELWDTEQRHGWRYEDVIIVLWALSSSLNDVREQIYRQGR